MKTTIKFLMEANCFPMLKKAVFKDRRTKWLKKNSILDLFVALVGRPNVGKSYLDECGFGGESFHLSAHAQTTRNKITGVWNGKNSQVVFLDTPGMHKPQSKLGQVIRQSTVDALDKILDVIVFICACDDPLGAGSPVYFESAQG